MLSAPVRDALNRSNDWVSNKNKLGDLVHKNFNVVRGTWKFSRDGGATGDYNLKDQDGVAVLKVPSGSVVLNVFAVAVSAVTSGGLMTVDINLEAANDLLAAEAVASFSAAAKIAGIPDFATLSDSVVTTAERTLTLSLNTAAATAGEIAVYVFYV